MNLDNPLASPYHALPHISRPDEWVHSYFNQEMNVYKRGFTAGVFGNHIIKTGGGKSVGVACLARELDPSFDVFSRVVFSPAEGLRLMEEFERKKMHGAMMIFEESQGYASNRT